MLCDITSLWQHKLMCVISEKLISLKYLNILHGATNYGVNHFQSCAKSKAQQVLLSSVIRKKVPVSEQYSHITCILVWISAGVSTPLINDFRLQISLQTSTILPTDSMSSLEPCTVHVSFNTTRDDTSLSGKLCTNQLLVRNTAGSMKSDCKHYCYLTYRCTNHRHLILQVS
jgi:hypothetical protein